MYPYYLSFYLPTVLSKTLISLSLNFEEMILAYSSKISWGAFANKNIGCSIGGFNKITTDLFLVPGLFSYPFLTTLDSPWTNHLSTSAFNLYKGLASTILLHRKFETSMTFFVKRRHFPLTVCYISGSFILKQCPLTLDSTLGKSILSASMFSNS